MTQEIPSFSDYVNEIAAQYNRMLEDESLEESVYQRFFEQNPFMLSPLTKIGGQGVLLDCLVSQPRLQFASKRIPDFVWLTRNSLDFCPTFIEIEKPTKNCFNKDDKFSAAFHEAYDQLLEWETLLAKDDTKRILFEMFSLPKNLLDLNFKPTFVLIIGRKIEWEMNNYRAQKLGTQTGSSYKIIHSFDHIAPNDISIYPYLQRVVTCKQKNGKLQVISVPSAFVLSPALCDSYQQWTGFHEALDDNPAIPEDRKDCLHATFEQIVSGNWEENHRSIHRFGKRNVSL